jgi:acetyl esterase
MTLPLDPQARQFLDAFYAKNLPPIESMPLAAIRQFFDTMICHPCKAPIKEVKEISIPGKLGPIPLRLYFPKTPGPHRVFISIHGGGWVAASLDANEPTCKEICSRAECIVISVGYHLAPEHKFPGPLEDCFAATQWVFKHCSQFGGDPDKIMIGGDSAGGNLAAAVTLMMRASKGPQLYAQVLLYPVTNYNFDTLSYHKFATGYLVHRETVKWFWQCYLRDETDGTNPYASPLQATNLSGLPPALFIQADYDPLRDDGDAYAEKLKASGIPVEIRTYNSIHGFTLYTNIFDIARKALQDIADFLKANH